MALEKEKISSSQLTFLMTGFIASTYVVFSVVEIVAKHDLWLAIIAGFVEGLVFALIYIALAKKFPGKTIVQICDMVYGRYIGKAIAGFFVLFLLLFLPMYLKTFGSFFIIAIMPETPLPVFLIMLVFTCAYAVRNGIEVICRCGFILTIILMIETFLTIMLLLKDMKLTNFLPVFDLSLRDFLISGNASAIIHFGDIAAFLMVFPSLNKVKQAGKSTLLALTMGAAVLLLIAVRNTAVLGITGPEQHFPSYQAVRMINIRNIITRVEIINSTVFIMMMFLKLCVLYYTAVLGTAQLLHMRTYSPLILPVGAIAINLSLVLFEFFSKDFWRFGTETFVFLSFPIEVGIPLLTLIIAIIRGLPQRKTGECK